MCKCGKTLTVKVPASVTISTTKSVVNTTLTTLIADSKSLEKKK